MVFSVVVNSLRVSIADRVELNGFETLYEGRYTPLLYVFVSFLTHLKLTVHNPQ